MPPPRRHTLTALDEHGSALVNAIATRTAEVVAALTGLDSSTLLVPSELPGWSRLTIACHLRYGARTLERMTSDALRGDVTSFYPLGRTEQRPRTLAPDDGEAADAVPRSLAVTSRDLLALWTSLQHF